MRRFPWILTFASALLLAVLITLGVWQVQRLQWKEGLIARAEAAATSKPVPLVAPEPVVPSVAPSAGATPPMLPRRPAPPPASPVFPEFQRVIISCHWETLKHVELRSIHDGVAGVRIISLCRHGGRTLGRSVPFLVDRGFIADGVSKRPGIKLYVRPPDGPGDPIVAQARTTPPPSPMSLPPSGRMFYARDNRAIATALGLEPGKPFGKQVLFAEQTTAPEVPELIAEPPPASFANNHLGYAITWFGLALALAAFYIALLRRKLNPPAAPREDPGEESSS
jgi:surfeit locus 1 family protein